MTDGGRFRDPWPNIELFRSPGEEIKGGLSKPWGSGTSEENPSIDMANLPQHNSQSLNKQPGSLHVTNVGLLHIYESYVACSS